MALCLIKHFSITLVPWAHAMIYSVCSWNIQIPGIILSLQTATIDLSANILIHFCISKCFTSINKMLVNYVLFCR
jgi:hypothetical protein